MVALGLALGLVLTVALVMRTGGPVDDSRDGEATLVESRELRFLDRHDGAVVILSYPDGHTVEVLDPGTNGFVRGVMRGMARERRSRHIDSEPPYRLAVWSDGRLTLDDPSTGRWIELAAFGQINATAFATLLGSASSHDDG
jgi:putative photosynthetic complex assembly protein